MNNFICLNLLLYATTVFGFTSIVSNHGDCTILGAEIVNDGGSIIDASIGIMLCEGLVNPQDTGIGGGFTGLVRMNKVTYMINARERAPKLQTDFDSLQHSTIGIPGAVDGYRLIHEKWGVMPFKDIMFRVLRLCLNGINASPRFLALASYYYFYDILVHDGVIKNNPLCYTFIGIALHGTEYFYKNSSKLIIKDLEEYGSGKGRYIRMEDFETYRAKIQKPSFRQTGFYKLYSVDYPGVGEVLLDEVRDMILYQDTYDLVESQKLLYDEIYTYRFEKFYNVSLPHKPDEYGTHHGTSNICIQQNLEAACFTSTINTYFGSRFYSRSTGVILNNQLADFPHYYKDKSIGGEQPPSYSSIFMRIRKTGGLPDILLGATGGNRIPSGVLNVLYGLIVLKEDLKTSIERPRVFATSKFLGLEECEHDCRKYKIDQLRYIRDYNNVINMEKTSYNTVTGIYKKQPEADPRRGGSYTILEDT